jgi:hypothetical protein
MDTKHIEALALDYINPRPSGLNGSTVEHQEYALSVLPTGFSIT